MRDGGTNFAVAAAAADGMLLCLFDRDGAENQIPLLDYDAGVWHGFVPGAGAGQAYGYRAAGRYDPGSGLRFNPAKLLLDPYARAIAGEVRFGPEVLGYRGQRPGRAEHARLSGTRAAQPRRGRDVQLERRPKAPAPLRGHGHGCRPRDGSGGRACRDRRQRQPTVNRCAGRRGNRLG